MINDLITKTGIMVKRPAAMSADELAEWKKKSFERARDYLFSIGQPLVYYQKDGTPVAEYRDGRIESLK
ncbi:hypothetical protein [Dyadobacter sp. MSC1_007]|jgi:hypothetical protein|uniref:hypothetical protein n=1 Tax=Dyadobacter sp. MSC1_007 TaxID=2909264 RepID=UPI0020301E4B|nr:hypothetical protein [Dyadobacter sp. MSC1_007]